MYSILYLELQKAPKHRKKKKKKKKAKFLGGEASA